MFSFCLYHHFSVFNIVISFSHNMSNNSFLPHRFLFCFVYMVICHRLYYLCFSLFCFPLSCFLSISYEYALIMVSILCVCFQLIIWTLLICFSNVCVYCVLLTNYSTCRVCTLKMDKLREKYQKIKLISRNNQTVVCVWHKTRSYIAPVNFNCQICNLKFSFHTKRFVDYLTNSDRTAAFYLHKNNTGKKKKGIIVNCPNLSKIYVL